MSRNKYWDELRREIEKYPGVSAEFGHRRKHHQVTLKTEDGRSRFVVFPASPSNSIRGLQKTIKDVRGELRNLGVAA
jgi:hypothetical protein